MKRFQFRAASILDLRRREFETAQVHLADAQRESAAAAAAVADADRAVVSAEHDLRARLIEGVDVGTIERHRNWIGSRRAGAEGCRQVMAEKQIAVERAAADVRRAHRQVRVLERWRDRALRTYQREAQRLEAIAMDELAVSQFARRRMETER